MGALTSFISPFQSRRLFCCRTSLFMRRLFHVGRLFCHYWVLMPPVFGDSGRLCFVIVAFPDIYRLYIYTASIAQTVFTECPSVRLSIRPLRFDLSGGWGYLISSAYLQYLALTFYYCRPLTITLLELLVTLISTQHRQYIW